jgi:hypothetical protein
LTYVKRFLITKKYLYKMRNIYNLILIAFLICMFVSCASTTPKYLYAPNGLNLIQVEKKNDIKAALNYAGTGHGRASTGSSKQQTNGINIQTAYAVTNKIAIKADLYKYWENDESLNNSNPIFNFQLAYKRQSADFAIGYFNNTGEDNKISFNAFAGIGFGSNSFEGYYRNEATQRKNYESKFFKFFAMPSITYKQSNNYSISLGYKLSVVKFNNLITNDSTLKEGFYKDFTRSNSVFGDFALDNQFSFNNLKGFTFHAIIGKSTLYTTLKDVTETQGSTTFISGKYFYNNRFAAIGVIADLHTIFAKK